MTLAVGVHDVHALQKRGEFRLFVEFLEDLVELFLVYGIEPVFGGKPVVQSITRSIQLHCT